MNHKTFNLMKSDAGFNYRFIQPPQIAYLVSTIDTYGNTNVTPVTLGTCVGVNSLSQPKESNYFYAFSVGSAEAADVPVRHAFRNLEETPECVISYPGANLIEQIWVCGLPIPAGINELEVARLTALPSQQVQPDGIKDCPINLEARIHSSCAVGDHYKLYICQIVAASVDEALIERDNRHPLHYGVLDIDPVFEVAIAYEDQAAPRLYFGQIDKVNIKRNPDDIGSSKKWIGTFEEWIEDECDKGKVSNQEKLEIIRLQHDWEQNPDPNKKSTTKKELTAYLSQIVWDRR